MPLNTIPPNSIKQLHHWRVMEAVWPGDIRTRHVCAENAANDMGISTSSIQEFDPVALAVKTRSGKTYLLLGQPKKSPLAEAAWHKWCGENDIVAEHDVTREYQQTEQNTPITFKKIGFRHEEAAAF
jgi:hypothetical protein